ncbi:MAG: hypothetical protein PHH00_02275 [Candidatus Nanoarchaeia archaeon]|nr:hypothetical protein [Candidatus Nanoarchaeia archaeon]
MAVKDGSKEIKVNELEGLSLGALNLRVIKETIEYMTRLLSSPEVARERITEEYLQRTKPLCDEMDRKEQLYLEGHRANIRY